MKKANLFTFIILLSFSLLMLQSCDPEDANDLAYDLGWYGDEDSENIEDDINLGTQFGNGDLPSSVDLLEYFPPLGNQGAYGTCVAWACGYNLRGFLDRKAGGNNTYSAKDLFWAIDNSSKGEDCNGTSFQVALDVMVSRGIATESVVPYDGLGDCSSSPEAGWTTNANQNKIENYREIDVDKDEIKGYLANGRAVVFGAKLGDQFMNANSDEVLDFQDYGYTGDHAYHAMILGGYDDSKGANGAFKVVNSWGSGWGDAGYLWVDQEDSGFNFAYDMPATLNGSYYFVCIADGFDVIDESNEENNYFWYTKENGDPFEVVNGVVESTSTKKMAINKQPKQNDPSPSPTAISKRHVNAYSPAEINQMIIAHKESGDLQKKVMQFVNTKRNKSKTKAK